MAQRLLEPLTDIGLDMIDELFISGLTKGWSPKLFMDDIERLYAENRKNL